MELANTAGIAEQSGAGKLAGSGDPTLLSQAKCEESPRHRLLWRSLKVLVLLVLFGVTSAGVLLAMRVLSDTPGVYFDFGCFYTAGYILRTKPANQLYDLRLQEKIERQVDAEAPFIPYPHTPIEALLFLPLTRLPFRPALLIWSFVNLVLLALGLYLFRYAGSLALLCLAAWQFRSIGTPVSRSFDLEFSLCIVAALLSSYHLWDDALVPLILVAYVGLSYQHTARLEGVLRRDHSWTVLLLMFSLLFALGPNFGFRAFCVLVIPLLGLCAWLCQEIRALRAKPLPV